MEYRKFDQGYVLRLDPGEEVVSCLTRLVEQEQVQLGCVSALGAANDVTIGIFDTTEKQYHARRCQGQFEISALVGNVTRKDGEPYLRQTANEFAANFRSRGTDFTMKQPYGSTRRIRA